MKQRSSRQFVDGDGVVTCDNNITLCRNTKHVWISISISLPTISLPLSCCETRIIAKGRCWMESRVKLLVYKSISPRQRSAVTEAAWEFTITIYCACYRRGKEFQSFIYENIFPATPNPWRKNFATRRNSFFTIKEATTLKLIHAQLLSWEFYCWHQRFIH